MVVIGLGVLAALVPVWPGFAPEWRLGLILAVVAILEMIDGFRRASVDARRSAWMGGAITLAMGALLMNAPKLMEHAIAYLVAGWFGVDGFRHFLRMVRTRGDGESRRWEAASMLGNFAVVALILFMGERGRLWTVAIAAALRIFGSAASILREPSHLVSDAGVAVTDALDLSGHPALVAEAKRINQEEIARVGADRGWIWTLLITLFAIHLGRMGFDRSVLGVLSPVFAVIGDVAVALAVAFVLLIPLYLLIRRLTLPLERRLWIWSFESPAPSRRRKIVQRLLARRLRRAIRLRLASYSLRDALGRGLQIGLPVAAVVVAIAPILGMSWYFDTENWAADIWDSWAESRTDVWRESMVHAVVEKDGLVRPGAFSVHPPGIDDGSDFSFVVIGDTGEGDASQHVLRDQIIRAMDPVDARFLIISSDVVYPTGAMKDYEARFWLPFKGVSKPVYAIPGNHDWYDALEAFAATFMDKESAVRSMRARAAADYNLTGGSEAHFQRLVQEAERLRAIYQVPTGFQQGSFFQIQTPTFALFAVDTGVRKCVDPAQRNWLESALASAKGKFKMAIMGHPLYAVGEYQAAENAEFAAIHELLKEHDVRIVMAGDTHDLEYYSGKLEGPGVDSQMHHFVNGGGGAFLSIGAALIVPRKDSGIAWARYPSQGDIVRKIESLNPFWKLPFWWWTRKLNGWPYSAEWLSAAFDYNVGPYFQSFFVIRVENSKRRVLLMPWGIHGRLKWSELETSALPPGASADDFVEWGIPMIPFSQ